MAVVELPALRGGNPLALFAALGALDVATRALPDRRVSLRWSDELEPRAILDGPDSADQLTELIDADRQRWQTSPVLTWGPNRLPLEDLKPSLPELRTWIGVCVDQWRRRGDPAPLRLLSGLVAEGAPAGNGTQAKPTDFHFTAGQQRFLVMVRELAHEVTADEVTVALLGPWTYASKRPVLGWDARGDRVWALRGKNPSGDKKTGDPGVDWLGFLGLTYFPVALRTDRRGRRSLTTTGCDGSWKVGRFRWPLWSVPLTSDTVRSLLADRQVLTMTKAQRHRLGVTTVLQAKIRRSDQGGYGSFGPPGPADSE